MFQMAPLASSVVMNVEAGSGRRGGLLAVATPPQAEFTGCRTR